MPGMPFSKKRYIDDDLRPDENNFTPNDENDFTGNPEALIYVAIFKHRTVVRYKNKKYIANRRLRAIEIRDLLDEWIRTEFFDAELRHGG